VELEQALILKLDVLLEVTRRLQALLLPAPLLVLPLDVELLAWGLQLLARRILQLLVQQALDAARCDQEELLELYAAVLVHTEM